MWFLRGEKVERETCWWRRRLFMGHTFLLIYHCIIFHFYGKKGYTHHSQPGRRNKRSTGRLSFLNLDTSFTSLHLHFTAGPTIEWHSHCSEAALFQVKPREPWICEWDWHNFWFATPESCKTLWMLYWKNSIAAGVWVHGK